MSNVRSGQGADWLEREALAGVERARSAVQNGAAAVLFRRGELVQVSHK